MDDVTEVALEDEAPAASDEAAGRKSKKGKKSKKAKAAKKPSGKKSAEARSTPSKSSKSSKKRRKAGRKKGASDPAAEELEAAEAVEAPEEAPPEPETEELQADESPEEAEAPPAEEAGADAGVIEEEESKPYRRGPGNKLDDAELEERVAALLFASPEPLSVGRLAHLLERPDKKRVSAAVEAVRERLKASGLPFEVGVLGGGYTLLTVPDLGEVVGALFKNRKNERVSPAALETLAIVAYRQPVTKAEIEAIRGVQAGPILRSLVDRGFAKVVGRADVPGHPLQYGTTKEFLDRFGLASLDDLPRDAELARD